MVVSRSCILSSMTSEFLLYCLAVHTIVLFDQGSLLTYILPVCYYCNTYGNETVATDADLPDTGGHRLRP